MHVICVEFDTGTVPNRCRNEVCSELSSIRRSIAIFTKVISKRAKRSLAALLLTILTLMLTACGASTLDEGTWVVHDIEFSPHPDSVFYVLEKKSPFGELEKFEDSQGYQRICLMLEFTEDSSGSSDGDKLYTSHTVEDAEWRLCREYAETDKPKFVSESIPSELRNEFGLD